METDSKKMLSGGRLSQGKPLPSSRIGGTGQKHYKKLSVLGQLAIGTRQDISKAMRNLGADTGCTTNASVSAINPNYPHAPIYLSALPPRDLRWRHVPHEDGSPGKGMMVAASRTQSGQGARPGPRVL